MLTNDDIERIEQQYSSRQERCLRSLEAWVSKDIRADIPALARILRSLGFKPLARTCIATDLFLEQSSICIISVSGEIEQMA